MKYLFLPLRAVFVLFTLFAMAAPVAAAQTADVSLRLWPSAREVKAGDVVTIEIMVDNQGDGRASYTHVDLEYVREEIDPFRTRLSESDMWVSELGARKLTVEFGHVQPKEERRALIFFHINENLPPGFRIIARATAHWQDADGKQKISTNPIVISIAGNQPAEPNARIEPAVAPAAALFHVSANHYYPNETVVLWLNMPDGTVRPIDTTSQTDGSGTAEFDLRLSDLPPGSYGLVVCGHISRIIQVVTLTITT